jgi:uncharacterized protein YrrD
VLISTKSLKGFRINGLDGSFGKVDDVYFDDRIWNVQYLVAGTGSWLPARKVLLPRAALDHIDTSNHVCHVKLTKQEIQNGPPIAADEPVSRHYETTLFEYFKLAPYWGADVRSATYGPGGFEGASEAGTGDTGLRSCRELYGYGIEAADGDIGKVDDFIVDDRTWVLRYAVIDTRKWLPGRKVLVAIPWIKSVSWTNSRVRIEMTREEIQGSPEFDPREPINREYENVLYDYYGRPGYWGEPGPK